MFSQDVPSFTIDLSRRPRDRWDEVIRRTREASLQVIHEAERELSHLPQLLRRLFAQLYRWRGGRYNGEIAAWAKGLGVSVGTATILNCAYEMSHLHLPRVFGCTAGARWLEGRGMVHVRTLDWTLPAMGAATCLFRFRRGAREFIVVGVPGHVGVLSGMRPGAWSATINWAPPGALPNFSFGPAFLLRNVLERCDTYPEAVRTLRTTPLSTSVFFTVCGVAPGEACVIERTQRAAVVREAGGGVIAQANHHEARRFAGNNSKIAQMESADFFAQSGARAEMMARALGDLSDAGDAASVLNLPPVLNRETVQKMVFCPRTAEVAVWRRVEAGADPLTAARRLHP